MLAIIINSITIMMVVKMVDYFLRKNNEPPKIESKEDAYHMVEPKVSRAESCDWERGPTSGSAF